MPTVTSPDTSAKAKRFLPPPALAIYNRQISIQSAAGEANYARQLKRDAERPELQNLYVQLQANAQHPKPDKDVEKELLKQIAEFKAGWAAEDAEHEVRQKDFMNNATPSAIGILEPWLRLDVKSRQESFGFTEELPEGKTPRDMVDLCREAHKPLAAKRKAIINAPQTADETAATIAEQVARIGGKTILELRNARFLDFDPDKNRFRPRPFKLPALAILDGVGSTLRIPDALGLMCLIWPDEITDRLTALAMGGERDDPRAMTRDDREAAFDDVEAELLANARRGEFWIRVCQSRNIAGGIRFTEDPRAILDLV